MLLIQLGSVLRVLKERSGWRFETVGLHISETETRPFQNWRVTTLYALHQNSFATKTESTRERPLSSATKEQSAKRLSIRQVVFQPLLLHEPTLAQGLHTARSPAAEFRRRSDPQLLHILHSQRSAMHHGPSNR